MKNYLSPLISLNLDKEGVILKINSIIQNLIENGNGTKVFLNLNISLLMEEQLLDKIKKFNQTSDSKIRIIPASFSSSNFIFMSFMSVEEELAKTFNFIKVLLVEYDFIEPEVIIPFYLDNKRDYEARFLSYFKKYVKCLCKRNGRSYLVFKDVSGMVFYRIVPFQKGKVNFFKKLLSFFKIESFYFYHLMIDENFDENDLTEFIKSISSKRAEVGFEFDGKGVFAKRLLNKDEILPLVNPSLSFSFKRYKSFLSEYKDLSSKKKIYSSYTLPNAKIKKNEVKSNFDKNFYIFSNSGLTEIAEGDCTLHFKNGILNKLLYKNRSVFSSMHSESFIKYKNGDKRVYLPSVSFAQDNFKFAKGISSSYFFIEDDKVEKSGSLIVSYMFFEKFLFPIMHLKIKYPKFKKDVFIDCFSPFSLSFIFNKSAFKKVDILNRYKDLSVGNRTYNLNGNNLLKKDIFPGDSWIFKTSEGSLCIALLQNKEEISLNSVLFSKHKDKGIISFSLLKNFENSPAADFEKQAEENIFFALFPECNSFLSVPEFKESLYSSLEKIK